ncbi:MAG: hypothetical protein ACKPFK_09090, partial [Dolichospermum sp.]
TNRDITDSALWIVKADSLTCRLPYFNVNKDMKDVNEEFDRFLKNDWLESIAVYPNGEVHIAFPSCVV